MKSEIKNYAIKEGIYQFYKRCGERHDFERDDSIKKKLQALLPVHYNGNVKGAIESIKTTSFEEPAGGYYPKGSFYRVSIIYIGDIPKQQIELNECGKEDTIGLTHGRHFFFRNSTVHFDIEMNFISVQHHHNQSSYKWHEYSSQFEEIFRNVQ